ncbi:MAG: PTS fructose transporter subunit IIA [Lachnospiraceae bacterium]|nr:PTS fructose transporter subunit IIA [Lachnospiraceae bacterium]
MVELVVITHGNLAFALKETSEMLLGEQEHIAVFGLQLGESIEELRDQAAEAIGRACEAGEVLVITDMISGSPFNIACSLLERYSFEHLTGINFPLFLEILSNRDELSARGLVEMSLNVGGETIKDAKKYFEEVE